MLFRIRSAAGRLSPATVIAVVALVFAVAGVSYAVIPGSDGTVTACISRDTFKAVIDAEDGQTCKEDQTTVKLATTDESGKVANADKLDGTDSTGFSRMTADTATGLVGPPNNPVKLRISPPGGPAIAVAQVFVAPPDAEPATVSCLLTAGAGQGVLDRREITNDGDFTVSFSLVGVRVDSPPTAFVLECSSSTLVNLHTELAATGLGGS